MIDTPKISVCVPLYNKAAHAQRCLATILADDPGGLELVIFDNGSTDGSTDIAAALAAADPRVRHIRLEHTLMIQESWRMALLHGRGELLKLHSADDELHPDFWQHMLPPLERSPDLDFTLCTERPEVRNVPHIKGAVMGTFYDGINANCRSLLGLTDPQARVRALIMCAARGNGLGNIYKALFRRRCLPLDRWRALIRAYPMPTSYPDWDFLVRLMLNHRGYFVEQILSNYTIAPDAPIARLISDPELRIADAHQKLLLVLTVLADPTLQTLRAALSPADIQTLHDEATRHLTQTVNAALALPPARP